MYLSKKIILLFLLSFFLVSCSDKLDEGQQALLIMYEVTEGYEGYNEAVCMVKKIKKGLSANEWEAASRFFIKNSIVNPDPGGMISISSLPSDFPYKYFNLQDDASETCSS